MMNVIMTDKEKEIINILEKKNEYVVKVTKTMLYSFPKSIKNNKKELLKLLKKLPDMFRNRFHVGGSDKIKKIKVM
jgi:predicted ribosome quality control (RQC) complex YloA/Tae2 family protein